MYPKFHVLIKLDYDKVLPLIESMVARREIHSSELFLFPEAGHCYLITNNPQLNDLLINHLKELAKQLSAQEAISLRKPRDLDKSYGDISLLAQFSL